jgi:hypothetical protein
LEWHGFTPGAGFLLTRLVLVLIAVALALLPVLWFPRFDPARVREQKAPASGRAWPGWAPPSQTAGIVRDERAPTRYDAPKGLPSTPARPGGAPGVRLLVGEVRILLQGIPRWWWLGVAVLAVVAQTVTPVTGVTRILLPLAWIWPVLIWSRLGTQRHEYGVEAILGAYPTARRRVAAEWAAGLLLTAVAGIGPALRLVTGSDRQGMVHWISGALCRTARSTASPLSTSWAPSGGPTACRPGCHPRCCWAARR